MVAWLLTRIFSFFYYRGEQRKLEKELSELWDAYQAELHWLRSYASDLIGDTSDVLVAVIAIKRLEERGYDTLFLNGMLEQIDATFAAKVSFSKDLYDGELERLLLAIRERDSDRARTSRSQGALGATPQSKSGREKKQRLRAKQTRRSRATEQRPSAGRRQRRHRL